jgi:hypothetical protein
MSARISKQKKALAWPRNLQDSQIDWSQQGRRKAFTANLLQMAHRSLNGISSWDRVLDAAED